MPKYGNPGSEDMYSDAPAPAADTAGAGGADEGGEEYAGETAVLPRSILAGKQFNVGDEVVLEIVRLNEDSVEVKYATGEDEGEGEGEGPDQGEGYGGPPADTEMASMME